MGWLARDAELCYNPLQSASRLVDKKKEGETMFTRKQYMNHECSHREYYAQFVTEGTRQVVLQSIGRERLEGSTDPHLNDIPLRRWDHTPLWLPQGSMKERGDWLSPAGKVCILKEAARQILETEEGV